MEGGRFSSLGDVVLDPSFPDVDLALRRGCHIDRDDAAWYALLVDGQALLEEFYRRFGCELVHKSDGFFYLVPLTDRLPKRQLTLGEMLVGQALALLLLDPCSVESGGVVGRDVVLARLAQVMGTQALVRAFNPKKKRLDERVAQETVRTKVGEAVRRLAALGFVEPLPSNRLRLRSPLMRFAEPVRGSESREKALAALVASGEVAQGFTDTQPEDADAEEDLPGEEEELEISGFEAKELRADGAAAGTVTPETPASRRDEVADAGFGQDLADWCPELRDAGQDSGTEEPPQ